MSPTISATFTLSLLFITLAFAAIEEFKFDQKLDHFNSSSKATFPQRYWIMQDYWDKGEKTPVMLVLGLAGPLDPKIMQYAGVYAPAVKTHKALAVAIENRFYGKSLNADMLSRENLNFLTFEQSLEDTVAIQKHIMEKYAIEKLEWIVFGASYSGLKSVLHRLKFPQNFYAAFASSAPLAFQYDMPDYFGHVGDVILDKKNGGSQACYDNVREVFIKIDHLLDKKHFYMLRGDFNICGHAGSDTEKDRYAFGRHLSGLLADINQNSFSTPGENPYARICLPFTRPTADPYEEMKRIQWEYSPGQCANVSYVATLESLNLWKDGITDWEDYMKNPGGRAWGYEICANFGFSAYCDPEKGCPLSAHVSMQGQINMCQDAFGITEEQMKKASEKFLSTYGGKNPQTSRLLLTHGAVDCGYPYELTSSNGQKEIYSVTTNYVGHVRDMDVETGFEPLSLYMTRQFAAKHLDTWVKQVTTANAAKRYFENLVIIAPVALSLLIL